MEEADVPESRLVAQHVQILAFCCREVGRQLRLGHEGVYATVRLAMIIFSAFFRLASSFSREFVVNQR